VAHARDCIFKLLDEIRCKMGKIAVSRGKNRNAVAGFFRLEAAGAGIHTVIDGGIWFILLPTRGDCQKCSSFLAAD
jgi:hypothetical protein